MPRIRRSAEVTWAGNVARGTGAISADSGAFTELPYSLPTRIGQAEGKTSPEELLAAAHAGCFAMSLSNELSSAGTPPQLLDVRCTVTVDEVEGKGHQVVDSTIEATGHVPGADAAAFQRAVEAAHAGCTLSALVRASATVTIAAQLEEDS